MFGLIFFAIAGISWYVSWCKKEAIRVEYRDEAKKNGKTYYQDFYGHWWVNNTRVMENWIDGHHCLVSRHNVNKVLVDLYYEENKQAIEFTKKAAEITAKNKEKAIADGKLSYEIEGSGVIGLRKSLTTGKYFTCKAPNGLPYGTKETILVTYYEEIKRPQLDKMGIHYDKFLVNGVVWKTEQEISRYI